MVISAVHSLQTGFFGTTGRGLAQAGAGAHDEDAA
jgi:hypothetical protein